MKLKYGDYIRTKDGYIDKVVNVEDGFVETENLYSGDDNIFGGLYYPILLKDIKSHKKNIIDLIEVGDIVNGYPVMEPVHNGNVWYGVDEGYEQFKRAFGDIKTILTHEMYEQNCYKVGDVE